MQVTERVRIMSELAEQGSFSVAAVQSAYGLSYADARSVVGEMERLRMVKTDEDGAYHLTPYGKDVAERMFVGDDSERVKRLLCEKILILTCPDMKAPECATDYNKDISEICEDEEEDGYEEYDEEYEYDGYDADEFYDEEYDEDEFDEEDDECGEDDDEYDDDDGDNLEDIDFEKYYTPVSEALAMLHKRALSRAERDHKKWSSEGKWARMSLLNGLDMEDSFSVLRLELGYPDGTPFMIRLIDDGIHCYFGDSGRTYDYLRTVSPKEKFECARICARTASDMGATFREGELTMRTSEKTYAHETLMEFVAMIRMICAAA